MGFSLSSGAEETAGALADTLWAALGQMILGAKQKNKTVFFSTTKSHFWLILPSISQPS